MKETSKKNGYRPFGPDAFSLPDEGLSRDERLEKLKFFASFINIQKYHFLGYQANEKMEYQDEVKQFLDCHINNIGDPFIQGNFTLNSKEMETAVLDYFASLWNARLPHNQEDEDSYWGYILTMGSTEGNMYAHWTARDYLAGRKLIIDKEDNQKPVFRYLAPRHLEEKPNAYRPVAFFSEDTHYSVIKIMRIMQIPVFSEIGNNEYPDDNPLDPGRPWPEEVPSENGNKGPGSVDIDKLATLVEFFASKGHPILVNCNYGSTFKGAYDNVKKICDRLRPIFTRYGLVDREVEYEPGKSDIRNGFWIHVDGALGASYMPFIEKAYKKKLIDSRGPVFDFRDDSIVNSIVMSGHKWPGAPWPCGLFMTKVKYQVFPPSDPEYIGSPDTTFAGSRSGFSPIILWDFLARHSHDQLMQQAVDCETLAAYAEEQLKNVKPHDPDIRLYVERTPLALTIRFRKPNNDIVFKYTLSCETLEIDGKPRDYAHIYIMESTSRELINEFCRDLEAEGAFDIEAKTVVRAGMGRAWR